MFDKPLVLSILKQIEDALGKIKSRTSHIHSANDFTDTPAGMEKLDGIFIEKHWRQLSISTTWRE